MRTSRSIENSQKERNKESVSSVKENTSGFSEAKQSNVSYKSVDASKEEVKSSEDYNKDYDIEESQRVLPESYAEVMSIVDESMENEEGIWKDEEILPEGYAEVESILEDYERDLVDARIQKTNEEVGDFVSGVMEEDDEDDELDDIFKEEDSNKNGISKRWKIGLTIMGIVSAAIILVLVMFFIFDGVSGDPLKNIQSRIDRLYSSDAKTDLKSNVDSDSINNIYNMIEEYDATEEDEVKLESMGKELDTIGYYLSDRNLVEDLNSPSYDLSSESLLSQLNSVKENSKKYSVSGLTVTINDKVSAVEKDYNYYVQLKEDLEGITDLESFSESSYRKKIDKVKHTVNKSELETIYNRLVIDKAKVEAEKAALEAASKAATEAEKKAAEEAQKAAEEKAAEAEKALEEANKLIEEQKQKAGDVASDVKEKFGEFIDNITGNKGSEESTNSETE